MLVSFAVTNWACFRERQELSAQAVSRTPDAFAFDTGVRGIPRLNRVTAIYGANGSGKSRLVEALKFMRDFVVGSFKEIQAGGKIDVVPFLFDVETRQQPTTFEICFIGDEGVVYEYVFSADSKRVHDERLSAWLPRSPMRGLLDRRYDTQTDSEEWKFGATVRGPKSFWKSITRENALLVSVAAQANSDVFRPVVDWFHRLGFVTPDFPGPDYTVGKIASDDDFRGRVMNLLRDADIRGDALVTPKVPLLGPILEMIAPPLFDVSEISIAHSVTGDVLPYRLNLTDESAGTQRLFSLAGPWLDAIDNSRIVVVDELDSSLHSLLVAALIGYFNRERHSGRGGRAQLVATLHDVTLLSNAFHRGQVWLAEKERQTDACRLKALSDYHRRRQEAIRTDYLDGRYGGVPVIVESGLLD